METPFRHARIEARTFDAAEPNRSTKSWRREILGVNSKFGSELGVNCLGRELFGEGMRPPGAWEEESNFRGELFGG